MSTIPAVMSAALIPKTQADREKMKDALAEMAHQDSTFKVHRDLSNGQTRIAGMSELHLESIVSRMMREYKVEAHLAKPQVNYRETIGAKAEAECRFVRQTSSGLRNYGHVKIRLEPNEPSAGFEFVDSIKGGVVPKEFLKPTEEGIREASIGGILAGYEVVDFKAVLFDGSYHDVDSNAMAFKIAGSMAFKEAARKANPMLLEPVMAVAVALSAEDYTEMIIADLRSRGGRIEARELVAEVRVIKATVPLSNIFGYATAIDSSTGGRADVSIQFLRYEKSSRGGYLGWDGSGVAAGKPHRPSPRSGSAYAQPDGEDE